MANTKSANMMISEAINCLNWNVIMTFYNNEDVKDGGHKQVTIEKVKKELRDISRFAIENNITEVDHVQWIILYKNNETDGKNGLGSRLEIIFVPTRAASFEDEFKIAEEEEDIDAMEMEILEELLEKSVKDERYELSAVLRDRMKKVKKLIKTKNN